MKKRIISILCIFSVLLVTFAGVFHAFAQSTAYSSSGGIIEGSETPLRLWYDEPAPITATEHSDKATGSSGSDIGWEQYSLPIGNGYMGANVFGRTETERIQITEKTLANNQEAYGDTTQGASYGGLNNFSETYIDFGHSSSGVTDYVRYLDLDTAISGVSYSYNGVSYTREYFASYPDKALVIRLEADKDGALSFTLRPTVPYKQSYMATAGDRGEKTGEVTSSVSDGVGYIELSGKLEYWDVDFLGIYKVYANGGEVIASTAEEIYKDTDGSVRTDINGTIKVEGATSAYIVVTVGTDYELSEEVFTANNNQKPTFKTTLADTRAKVEGYMSAIESRISALSFEDAYADLKSAHIADYSELFGRVTLEINPDGSDLALTTDELLEQYKSGDHSYYLESLMFQYGRYLLIASSREGTLPANLQGTWNTYESPPWKSGYWHNINVQMNYWPSFSTNLSELFTAYVDFSRAYMAKAEANATSIINTYNSLALGADGGNGWCIGVGSDAYSITSDRSAGNLGFTTQLYWDYYRFTKDEAVLAMVYDVLVNAARFITKCVELDADGNYLVSYSDSPEVHVNGVWYYTKGTTYAQTFAYLNNYNALAAARELGIDLDDTDLLSKEEYSILSTIMEQVDKYDPINVGLSGQIKEFREEDYYSSLGDDPNHRHVSQLVGLYPGTLINGTTTAWLDAAKATLEYRGGNDTGGWVYAHKMSLYARAKDGDSAGECLSDLLTYKTCPNLFTLLWSVYQIDASLGTTAGISEMLLQSHEGYIEPLAAIPSDWTDGSYTGLVARGNFEVSAQWKDGVATCFNITSNKGGVATVRYPSITGARVTDSDGRAVSYSVDGSDIISFNTEEGKTYIISGFKKIDKTDAPDSLSFERSDVFGAFDLSWSKVDGAKSYNVYVAVENAPAYTLIGTTKSNKMTYTPNAGEENSRTTFAVAAVSADGAESERILCYYNPQDTSAQITDVYGTVLESGELQITVIGNDNGAKYRLYEKIASSDAYVQIDESSFPLLNAEKYNLTSTYAVSACSYYDGAESELFVISTFNSQTASYDPNNILAGKVFEPLLGLAYAAIGEKWGYPCLTDGIIDLADIHHGRFSSSKNGILDATIDLGGTYKLYEIRFRLFEKSVPMMGTNFTIQALSNGKWVNVIENVSNEKLESDYLVKTGNGYADWILTIDMGGVEASKIRVHAESTSAQYVTFYECECSGIYIGNEAVGNLLVGKEIVGDYATHSTSTVSYGYDKLNDGIIDAGGTKGRYSNAIDASIGATIDLGGNYLLTDLRFYLFNRNTSQMGTDFTVEVYSNGEWITVLDKASNATLASNYLVSYGSGSTDLVLSIPLGNITGSKIRFNAAPFARWITFYECECYGFEVGEFEENLLVGREFVSEYKTHFDSRYPERSYTYATLTDGIIDTVNAYNGRFSNYNKAMVGGTLDLGGNYVLDELKFYLFNRNTNQIGTDFTVEVYSGGEWITIIKNVSNGTLISDYLVDHGSGAADLVLTIPLGNIIGSKIRFEATPISGYICFYECECSGYNLFDIGNEDEDSNVLYGAEGSVSGGAVSESHPVSNVFDNDASTYLEVLGTGEYTLDINFKFVQPIYTLRIYELLDKTNLINDNMSTASVETDVEVYVNGAWIRMINGKPLVSGGVYTVFDLCGIETSKIRITFRNTRLFGSETEYRAARISKITCTTENSEAVDRSDMIEALDKLSAFIGEDGFKNKYNDVCLKYKGYAIDVLADQAAVDAYAEEINSYYEYVTTVKHIYEAVVTAPTCTEAGYTTYTCTECGDSYVDDEVAKLGHSYEAVITAPDCVNGGYTTYTCSACGDSYVDDVVAKLGHSYETVVTAPTCTEIGYTTYSCSACGDSYVADETAAIGHNAGVPVIENTVDPTCVKVGGYDTATYCSVCGAEISRVHNAVPANGHIYESAVTLPDCVNGGYTTYTCSVCGDSYVGDNVAANGHTPEIIPGAAPSCIETGLSEGARCSLCLDVLVTQSEIPALGHTDDDGDYICDACGEDLCTDHIEATISGRAPTCVDTGLTDGVKCSICADIILAQQIIPVLGHSYEIAVTAPTCTDGGYTTYTCSVCGDRYISDATAALGHTAADPSIENAVDPTCVNVGGYDTVTCCSVCAAEISRVHTVEPALGHAYETVVAPPTCTEIGYTTYTCSVCDDSYVADKAMPLGHAYESVVTEPTCTEIGYTTYTCSVCDDSYVADKAMPLDHAYESVVTEPTCTESGYTTYTCTVCGDSYVADETAVLGHAYESVVTEPTCTESGYTTYTCTVCDDSYVADEVAALDHSYEIIVTDPTCTEIGYTTYTCSICGESYIAGQNSALGHSYRTVVTAPTCTEMGYTTHTCYVCSFSYVADEVDALGHDWIDATTEAPKTCQLCGETDGEKLPSTDQDDNSNESFEEEPVTEKDHGECKENAGGWRRFWLAIGNFFRRIFRAKKKCFCGEKISF